MNPPEEMKTQEDEERESKRARFLKEQFDILKLHRRPQNPRWLPSASAVKKL